MESTDTTRASDDAFLVHEARRGDRTAFRRLVERHQRKVYSLACGVLRDGDEACDVCQDAFLRAWRGLVDFDGRAQFSTWLHRITVNLCLDRLRRQRPTVSFDEAIDADEEDGATIHATPIGFDPGRALLDKELRSQLAASLDRLSPTHRTVLLLREVEGMSYKQIAEVMNCAEGTVMSRLFHARKRMQTELLAFHRSPDASVDDSASTRDGQHVATYRTAA